MCVWGPNVRSINSASGNSALFLAAGTLNLGYLVHVKSETLRSSAAHTNTFTNTHQKHYLSLWGYIICLFHCVNDVRMQYGETPQKLNSIWPAWLSGSLAGCQTSESWEKATFFMNNKFHAHCNPTAWIVILNYCETSHCQKTEAMMSVDVCRQK